MALVLAVATYDADSAQLSLTFDRAIDIASIDGSEIIVDDGGATSSVFKATGGATLSDPTTVRLGLVRIGDSSSSVTTLTAESGNGIIATNDRGAWPGTTDYPLP